MGCPRPTDKLPSLSTPELSKFSRFAFLSLRILLVDRRSSPGLISDERRRNPAGSGVTAGDDRIVASAATQNSAGDLSGAPYVFEASTGQPLSKLISSNSAAGDYFVWSLDHDSGLIAVGAPYSASNGFRAGATYIFDDSSPNSGQAYCFGDGTGVRYGAALLVVDRQQESATHGAPYRCTRHS
jgi:hypothetical protein